MTTQELRVLTSRRRTVYVKIEVLSPALNVVGVITGRATDGNYSLDKDSTTRRTCSVTFVPDANMLPVTADSPLWINRRFALHVGLLDSRENEIIWWKKGVYCIKDPSVDISVSGVSVSINGVDLSALADGTLGGQFGVNTKVEAGTNIATAIRSTIMQLGAETRVNIASTEFNVPYDIEKDATDNIWDLIDELTKLYMRYESYYDEDGRFVFTGTKVSASDTVSFDFRAYPHVVLPPLQHSINYSNVRNKVVVWGKLLGNGTQFRKTIEVRDANYPDCPFTIEKMGEAAARTITFVEDYYTQAQVDDRAEYEVEQHTNCAETVTITCVPIYGLEVNRLILLDYPDEGVTGKWCVDTISCGLKHDATMSITAHKIYN